MLAMHDYMDVRGRVMHGAITDDYKEVVGRAKQDARAEEQLSVFLKYARLCRIFFCDLLQTNYNLHTARLEKVLRE